MIEYVGMNSYCYATVHSTDLLSFVFCFSRFIVHTQSLLNTLPWVCHNFLWSVYPNYSYNIISKRNFWHAYGKVVFYANICIKVKFKVDTDFMHQIYFLDKNIKKQIIFYKLFHFLFLYFISSTTKFKWWKLVIYMKRNIKSKSAWWTPPGTLIALQHKSPLTMHAYLLSL